MSTVVVSLSGGLGNQLFQYAMGRALARRRGARLVLDLAWFEQIKDSDGSVTTPRPYALAPFELGVTTQCVGLDAAGGRLWERALRRLLRRLPRRRGGMPVYTERDFTFDPAAFALKTPVWLDGYWQSPRYFEDAAAEIRVEVGTPRRLGTGSRALLEAIRGSEAICLHVRRGDYVTNPTAAAHHPLCGVEYYRAGLERASAGLASPHCFVFSDDPDWARANLGLSLPATVVDVNGPEAPHEDLWLMSACRRFVIANSSLSWWGAWLSTSADKVVVTPRQWFMAGGHDTRDLIPESWERL
jgi:hypothetical protein